ncbi:MAG: ABC transporter ATP-binding protein [Acidobacteria bacterium]|nr:ABC transporter ATP-binding protein [Acidobacteriota bacterium]
MNKTNGAGIRIDSLRFSYHGHMALDDLNLKVEPGERLGIIGPTGAGKSTLLLHLNGILQGAQGSVTIGNTIVSRDTLATVRKKVGLVFQNPDDQLFNPTVEEDIAFGPLNFGINKEETAKRVKQAMQSLNLQGFEKESSHHLSYGERKRVALATVLALEPEVVAFDEPFANLDPGMVAQVVDIITNMNATVIVVSQSILPAFACCDRIAVLVAGKIVKTGTPKEIAKEKELLTTHGLDYQMYCDICKKL